MFDDLLLGDQTRKNLQNFLQKPSHALVLVGASGAGKPTVAKSLIATILATDPDKHPYYRHVQPTNNVISIDEIRALHEFTKLRTVGRSPIRRAVLIEDAHCLTIDAQNVFLKLLEEPPADTIFVLTATSKNGLLATIYSRAQHILLRPIAQRAAEDHYLPKGFEAKDVTKAFYLSDGQPGLIDNLLNQGSDHPLTQSIDQAKQLISAPLFERMAQVDALAKQKEGLSTLLWSLERICHSALTQASLRGSEPDIKRWIRSEKLVLQTQNDLSSNPQTKLLLTRLLLSL